MQSVQITQKEKIWRGFFYFIGLWFLALGVALTIKAELGVNPWDVLHLGLANVTTLSVGICSIIVGFVLLVIQFGLNRKRLKWGTLGNLILVGVFLDLILHFELVPEANHLWENWLLLLFGMLSCNFGAGLYIVADFGSGPRDGLTLELSERFAFSVRFILTILEVSALSIGWILGGPVAIGTLILSVTTGTLLQFFLKINRRILNYLTIDPRSTVR